VFVGNGLIVVVYQQSVIPSLIAGTRNSLKVLLVSGNNLLKSLFVNAPRGALGIKVNFIDALGEQPGETPSTYASCHFKYESPSLIECEMYVVLCLAKVLLGLLVQFVIRFGLKSQKFLSTCALHFGSPLIESEIVESIDPSLLRILP
jgi:hypothetical protein